MTASTDFPVASGIQAARAGGDAYNYDLFVAKLNPAGSAIVYSTYLGGSANEQAGKIRVDSSGRAVIVGSTMSDDFPTTNALQVSSAGDYDGVVTKLNAEGSALVFSTYLGGEGIDFGVGVDIDANGDIFIVGTTTSTTFPVQLPLKAQNNGNYDAFIARLAADGTRLVYSTYYGGGGEDHGIAIAVDANGAAYVAGVTDGGGPPPSTWFQTTTGAAQPSLGGGWIDAFVLKIDSNTLPSSGLVPLTVRFAVTGDATSIAVDFDGDSVVDFTGPALSEQSFTYRAPGLYVPAATVTRADGGAAVVRGVIQVYDRTAIQTLLKAKWDGMRAALIRGDIEAALTFFSEPRQSRYRTVFATLGGQIAQIAQDMQDIELIYVVDGLAKFRIRRTQLYGGQLLTLTYYINFVQDASGIWSIDTF